MSRAMPHRYQQIVYQIFPERFAIGQPHTSESKLALPEYQQPGFQRRAWDEPVLPADQPARDWAEGAVDYGKIFYGGDLQGVIDHLPYLEALGITTLYFTPIFTAPSNHKYDTTDFFQIDPMFGDEATLARLNRQAAQQGIGVVLDVALNHVSDQHPWFLAAQQGEQPYRRWFTFVDPDSGEILPADCAPPANSPYHAWWDFGHMPEMNLDRPTLEAVLFATPESLLQKYLSLGIQGWRLDCGQDIGLPFAQRLLTSVHQRYPKAELLGELMVYGGDWLKANAFTGIMNYYQRETSLAWLRGQIGSRQANCVLQESYDGLGHEGALASWNMLASHDTPRLKHLLPERWQRELALTTQFTLPGIPVIYYGEEVGMEGAGDPDNRRPMIWDETRWDLETLDFYRKLIALRQQHPALWEGRLTMLGDRLDGIDALIFLRRTGIPGESALVVINRDARPLKASVMLPDAHLYCTVPLSDRLGDAKPLTMDGGRVDLEVAAQTAAVFMPDERCRTFRFFKPRNQVMDLD